MLHFDNHGLKGRVQFKMKYMNFPNTPIIINDARYLLSTNFTSLVLHWSYETKKSISLKIFSINTCPNDFLYSQTHKKVKYRLLLTSLLAFCHKSAFQLCNARPRGVCKMSL